jgi:hypothetical protein
MICLKVSIFHRQKKISIIHMRKMITTLYHVVTTCSSIFLLHKPTAHIVEWIGEKSSSLVVGFFVICSNVSLGISVPKEMKMSRYVTTSQVLG